MRNIIKLFKERKSLLVILLLIVVEVTWLISSSNSYAFYGSEDALPMINSTIGNFASTSDYGSLPSSMASYDFNVQLYLQDMSDSNVYNLVNTIPAFGYILDEDLSNCKPESANYSNYDYKENKFIVNIQEDIPKQVTCSFYYKKDYNSDIVIYVLVKDDDYGIKEYGDHKYRFLYTLPSETYSFDTYECTNSDANTTLAFENRNFKISSKAPDVCYAYFV